MLLVMKAHRPFMIGALLFQCALRSEFELEGELHLPRRAGVAGRKACVGDYTKRRAPDLRCSTRLAEIGVVEKIKDLPAKLDDLILANFGALDDREVGVIERRPNDRVAPETAEVIDALAADKGDGQNRYGAGRA